MTLRGRRGWKKQDNQQQKARQDRLNSSRKHRSEDLGEVADTSVIVSSSDRESTFEIDSKDMSPEKTSQGKFEGNTESFQPYRTVAERKAEDIAKTGRPREQTENAVPSSDLEADGSCEAGNGSVLLDKKSHQHEPLVVKVEAFQSEASTVSIEEENSCRKTISGDRSKVDVLEVSLEEAQGEDGIETSEVLSCFVSVTGTKALRRQDSGRDRNPKPSKRRRSVQGFSEVSLKYCMESFVGFNDRLHDGFYDAGRDRPFLPLDVLEKEQLCYDSREVILVDR